MIYIVSIKDMNKDMRKEAQQRLFSYAVGQKAWEINGCELLDVAMLFDLELDKETIVIEKNEHGKPYISGNPWYFNLSHSGDYLAMVFSGRECGIDIQEHREIKNFFRMCAKLSPQEDRMCRDVGDCAFFDVWACKEAYGKCIGEGITNHVLKTYVFGGKKGFVFEQNPVRIDGYSLCVCYREN